MTTDVSRSLAVDSEAAGSLKTALDKAILHILRDRKEFNSYEFDSVEGWHPGDEAFRDPRIVAADVSAQLSFLRKLKFQYLEQNAKDKYIKTIVSDIDDAPLITAASNEELRLLNEEKKKRLKAAKTRLVEKCQDIRTLAPLVEQDYNKAKSLVEESFTLSQKILDARLALTRLRQAHPHPRLTIPLANATLDSQVAEMQNLDGQLQEANDDVARMKETAKERSKEVERLRMERAEVEKEVKDTRLDEEDETVIELNDWYTSSLALHRSLLSLVASEAVSENELRLTYVGTPPSELASRSPRKPITVTLVFLPNTCTLAAVHLDGEHVELGDRIDSHIERNDSSGLISAIMAQYRANLHLT